MLIFVGLSPKAVEVIVEIETLGLGVRVVIIVFNVFKSDQDLIF